MKSTLRVENHQPVPLAKFSDVEAAMGGKPGAVYLRFWDTGEERWFHYDPKEAMAFPLEGSHEAFLLFGNDSILARRLQPGERLVITFEG